MQMMKSVILYKHFPCLDTNGFLDEKSNFVLLDRPEKEKEADFMHI